MSKTDKNVQLTVIEGEGVYMGPERRIERRRECKNERVETLLKNFGLNRRIRTNRRKQGTSWLLTSQKVVNS